MKITYNWLKEFIDTGLTPSELHKKFFTIGIGIETFEQLYSDITKVYIGKLLSVEKHPNADKLTLCEVDLGTEILKIVCGAKNHKKGDKVAVAVNGATLPGGMKISKVELRGVESNGMICSEKELGLADSSAGVMILPEDAPLGKDFKETYGLNDWLYEIEVMPNKPEYLGILGIARVLGAALRKPVNFPALVLKEDASLKTKDIIKVKVSDTSLCPRYSARYISGITLKPSPLSIQVRLRSVGIRAINNIVDATNYVLIETGHPLHAFDAELIAEKTIIVRRAAAGEKMITLDGIQRELNSETLVISDSKKAVALAGIMGGKVSEINAKTTNILLESAYFDAVNIRKTSKKLGLMTEASYRFERGTDYEGLIYALNRSAQLINELGGGKIASGLVDEYPKMIPTISITTRYERVNKLLGTKISPEEMLEISAGLGFKLETKNDKAFTVTVPSFRTDLSREIDMVEEIAVIHGYDKIPDRTPRLRLEQIRTLPQIEELVKTSLLKRGVNEAINFTFIDNGWFDKAGIAQANPVRTKAVVLLNHLIENWNTLRPTLLPNLLSNLALNSVSHGNKNLKFMEIGKVFSKKDTGYEEHNELGLIVTGSDGEATWLQKSSNSGIYYLKGLLEGLLSDLKIDFTLKDINNDYFDKTCSVEIFSGGNIVGILGQISKKLLKMYGLKDPVYYAELNLPELNKYIVINKLFTPLPKFPANKRDISFIVNQDILAGDILSFIARMEHNLLTNLEIIDYYAGDKVEAGKKSITYSLTYRDPLKTLTDGEVDSINKDITQKVIEKYNATVRQ